MVCVPKKTTRSKIIKILAEEGLLNVQQLHSKINTDISCEAISVQVKKLLNEKILIKQDKRYQLNSSWINQEYMFFKKVKDKFLKNNNLSFPADVFIFSNLKTFDQFLLNFEKCIVAKKPSFIGWAVKHSWWNLFYLKQQSELLQRYKQNKIKVHSVFEGSTPLDTWNTKIYARYGMPAKSGRKIFSHDIGIYGEHVLFLIMPFSLQQELHNLFDSASSLEDIDSHYFFQIFEKEHQPPIQVFIYENEVLAQALKKKMLEVFTSSLL